MLDRRSFIQTGLLSAGGLVLAGRAVPAEIAAKDAPSYLKGYKDLYRSDPRAAALQWFREAKFGLFLHYGLYSLLGRHEWVQLKELIPVAEYANLLDGIAVPLSGDRAKFQCQELYDLIHRLQPQVLVSYKQGLLGTEDFFAPEHKAVVNPSRKPMEICSTLQDGSWGYNANKRNLSADEAWAKLAAAGAAGANLLLNTGPLPDGSICPAHTTVLREMGRRIQEGGFPSAPAEEVRTPVPQRKGGRKNK